jgi:hypothetical protein
MSSPDRHIGSMDRYHDLYASGYRFFVLDGRTGHTTWFDTAQAAWDWLDTAYPGVPWL